jgi:hypothetical protein
MPQSVMIFDKDGNVVDKLKVQLEGSGVMLPVDNQSNLHQTVQTHAGVTVGANSYINSPWIDANGFDKVGLTMTNDADVASTFGVHWSNDGSGFHADEIISTASTRLKYGHIDVKARYFRVYVSNKDTASHTFSAWAYLKV